MAGNYDSTNFDITMQSSRYSAVKTLFTNIYTCKSSSITFFEQRFDQWGHSRTTTSLLSKQNSS